MALQGLEKLLWENLLLRPWVVSMFVFPWEACVMRQRYADTERPTLVRYPEESSKV